MVDWLNTNNFSNDDLNDLFDKYPFLNDADDDQLLRTAFTHKPETWDKFVTEFSKEVSQFVTIDVSPSTSAPAKPTSLYGSRSEILKSTKQRIEDVPTQARFSKTGQKHYVKSIPNVFTEVRSRSAKAQWDALYDIYRNPNSALMTNLHHVHPIERKAIEEILASTRRPNAQSKAVLTAIALKYGLAKPVAGQPVYTGIIKPHSDGKSVSIMGVPVDAKHYNSPRKTQKWESKTITYQPERPKDPEPVRPKPAPKPAPKPVAPGVQTNNVADIGITQRSYTWHQDSMNIRSDQLLNRADGVDPVRATILTRLAYKHRQDIQNHPDVPQSEKDIFKMFINPQRSSDVKASQLDAIEFVMWKYNVLPVREVHTRFTGVISYNSFMEDLRVDGIPYKQWLNQPHKATTNAEPEPLKPAKVVVEKPTPVKPLEALGSAPAADSTQIVHPVYGSWLDVPIYNEGTDERMGQTFENVTKDVLNDFANIFGPMFANNFKIRLVDSIREVEAIQSAPAGYYSNFDNEIVINMSVMERHGEHAIRSLLYHELTHYILTQSEFELNNQSSTGRNYNLSGPLFSTITTMALDFVETRKSDSSVPEHMIKYYSEPHELWARLTDAYLSVRTGQDPYAMFRGSESTKYLNWWPKEEFMEYFYPALDDFYKSTGLAQ